MKPERSLPSGYFDDVYAASDDPWCFASSAYEAEKYHSTIEVLGARRFRRAFEIGCSIGVFTAQLAPRCGSLLAVDVSEAALAQARARCAALPQVHFERMAVPDVFPGGTFDLVATCEVAYYWSRDDLNRSASLITAALVPGGWWLLVHWTPEVADYPLLGDEVHDIILARTAEAGSALRHVTGFRHERYRLDLFERRPSHAGSR
jgi:SAM-dependent methyltransferase